jgi:hypothetical protein
MASIEPRAKQFNPHAIVFDISTIGPQLALRLDVPSIGVSNFDWHFIYKSLIPVNKGVF